MQYLCKIVTNILHITKHRKRLYSSKIRLMLTIVQRIPIFMVNIA